FQVLDEPGDGHGVEIGPGEARVHAASQSQRGNQGYEADSHRGPPGLSRKRLPVAALGFVESLSCADRMKTNEASIELERLQELFGAPALRVPLVTPHHELVEVMACKEQVIAPDPPAGAHDDIARRITSDLRRLIAYHIPVLSGGPGHDMGVNDLRR